MNIVKHITGKHFTVLLLLGWLLQSCAGIAITHTNIYDPHTQSILPDRTIVIRGERIIAVGSPEYPVRRAGYKKKIDGRNKYVIPGLIDAHAHLIYILDSVRIKGEEGLPLYLGAGVTSVRDIGDEIAAQKRLTDFADANPQKCPTVFMCSPLLEGAKPFHGTDPVSMPLTDTNRVAGYVDSLAAIGVSTLKIYVYASPAVFRKIIEEGHKRGLTVAAHLPSNVVKTEDALNWGIDVIEHIWGAPNDSALITQMVKQGTMIDPTLIVFKNMLYFNNEPEVFNNKDNDYVPDTLRALWDAYRRRVALNENTRQQREDQMNAYKQMTGRLYRAGITILAGSDAPEPYCPPGFSLHDELLLLVESGLPASAALNCATINNARALRQEKNLGSIEAGKIADMVVLGKNPLDNIRNTRKISFIIHKGYVLDPADILPDPNEW